MEIEVRKLIEPDIEKVVSYFVQADTEFLNAMGAEKSKLPNKDSWINNLQLELTKPYFEKNYFYIIWLIDNQPIGHSNVNRIRFGESATMHLHIWKKEFRNIGLGQKFLKMTVPVYFEKLKLKKLICEPYSDNIAPNKTLKNIGFELVRTYDTIPGPINFLENVNRYELTKDNLLKCNEINRT